MDRYWALVLDLFSKPMVGNPQSHLFLILRELKVGNKIEDWGNSNCIKKYIDYLHNEQLGLLRQTQEDPNNKILNCSLKNLNFRIFKFNSMLVS